MNAEVFACAGSDKRIRVYSFINNRVQSTCVLTGANQSVTRLDFDGQARNVLGASNDYNVRLWNIDGQRCLVKMLL